MIRAGGYTHALVEWSIRSGEKMEEIFNDFSPGQRAMRIAYILEDWERQARIAKAAKSRASTSPAERFVARVGARRP